MGQSEGSHEEDEAAEPEQIGAVFSFSEKVLPTALQVWHHMQVGCLQECLEEVVKKRKHLSETIDGGESTCLSQDHSSSLFAAALVHTQAINVCCPGDLRCH